jgi:hypothetical protein
MPATPEIVKLDKEALDKMSKDNDPMAFLKGSVKEEEDSSDDNTSIVKDEKPQPAKALKQELEKVKKERDELNKKLKELESKTGEISELEPLRPVAEYLKKKSGKIDSETVEKELIEKNRQRKKELAEKEEALKHKDQKIKEISIENSEEWHNDYIRPIQEAKGILEAAIINVDDEGNVRHPEMMSNLFSKLVALNDDGTPKTSLQLKSEIKKFAAEYERKTGLDYDPPLLKEVVDSISKFHNRIQVASKAKSDWEATLENKKKERAFESAKQRDFQIKKELEGRDYLFSEYKNSINTTQLEKVIEDSDIFINAAKEEHEYLKKALAGDPDLKRRDYTDFIDLAAKGKMFDSLMGKIQTLEKELAEIRGDKKSPKFNGGAKLEGEKKTEQIKLTPGYDPMGFLK